MESFKNFQPVQHQHLILAPQPQQQPPLQPQQQQQILTQTATPMYAAPNFPQNNPYQIPQQSQPPLPMGLQPQAMPHQHTVAIPLTHQHQHQHQHQQLHPIPSHQLPQQFQQVSQHILPPNQMHSQYIQQQQPQFPQMHHQTGQYQPIDSFQHNPNSQHHQYPQPYMPPHVPYSQQFNHTYQPNLEMIPNGNKQMNPAETSAPNVELYGSESPNSGFTNKASKRHLSNSKTKNIRKISAFVTKLYSMLHDKKLSNLIWWSRTYQNDEFTFALLPGSEFANCLTTYFKHGNVASFVRQLHMYGFHKICDGSSANSSSLNAPSNSEPNSAQSKNVTIWEFRHNTKRFKRNDPNSLHLIKRRTNSRRSSSITDANDGNTDDMVSTNTIPAVDEKSALERDEIVKQEEHETNAKNSPAHAHSIVEKAPAVGDSVASVKSVPAVVKTPSDLNTTSSVKSKTDGSTEVFRVPTPKSIQPIRSQLSSPHSSNNTQQPNSSILQTHVISRPYSPTGRLSPVSYRQNVFHQNHDTRQRNLSVLVDPCAPLPNNLPDRNRSPTVTNTTNQTSTLPNFQSTPLSSSNSNSSGNYNLPPISSISSVAQSPINSIVSAHKSSLNNRYQFSRNSSSGVSNSISHQLRPSIFDLYPSTNPNSSISAQNSIFSGSSLSSSGSLQSRNSSLLLLLNDDTKPSPVSAPHFKNSFASQVNKTPLAPISSSSLKTVTTGSNDTSTSVDACGNGDPRPSNGSVTNGNEKFSETNNELNANNNDRSILPEVKTIANT